MPAPALSIPVRANLDAFKKQMEETSSLAKTAARKAAQSFLDMNKEAATAAGAAAYNTAGIAALKLAGRIALVVGAVKLMGDAIGAARDQLKDMVALADKAQNVGVSSAFYQQFTAEAKKLRVEVGDLDAALSHAFSATKDRSPIDINQWESGEEQINAVEKALRVYNQTLAGGKLEGVVLFRDADNQEKKVQAVLKTMIQLEQIGQKAAALDLGERMFGSAFVDRIRQGKTSAEEILTTVQKTAANADAFFPEHLVQRAKQLDEQLRLAHDRLSNALKPAWNDLADSLLTIKGYWSDIVGLIAKAVEWTNELGLTSEKARLRNERAAIDDAIKNGTGLGGVPQVTWIPGVDKVYDALGAEKPQDALKRRRAEVQAKLDAMDRGVPEGPELPAPPSRGAGNPLTKKSTGSDTDKFDTGVDAINKRIAALQAEAGAIDLGTEARDRAKIAAQLETVAKQANAAAGKGNNVITDEQRKVIDEVAGAYGRATVAMEKAKVASQIKFATDTAFLSQEDVAIAAQLKGIYPDVATALNSVEAAGIRAANGMRQLHDFGQQINQSLFVEFGQNLRQGMSAWDAFKNAGVSALGKIADKLMSMAADQLFAKAFSGGGGGGLLGGLFGLFGGGVAPVTMGLGGLAAIHHGGYGPGDRFSTRSVGATTFRNAPRFHDGVGPGERAAVIRNDESVLTPGQMRALAPASQQTQQHVTVGVSVDDDGAIKAYVKNVVASDVNKGISDFSRSSNFQRLAAHAASDGQRKGWVR